MDEAAKDRWPARSPNTSQNAAASFTRQPFHQTQRKETMRTILATLSLALALVAPSAQATASWGPLEALTSVELGLSGVIYVGSPTYTACGSTPGTAKFGITDAAERGRNYATILLAYTTGKQVKLLTDGCDGAFYKLLGVSF